MKLTVEERKVKWQYTYEDGNIIVYSSESFNHVARFEFYYGKNKSRYYNARMKYCFDPLDEVEFFSVNELLESRSISWDGKTSYNRIYTYTYDDEGFPTSATLKFKLETGQTVDSGTIVYEYQMK